VETGNGQGEPVSEKTSKMKRGKIFLNWLERFCNYTYYFVVYINNPEVNVTSCAEGLVNLKSYCKKVKTLILDTPAHVDFEKQFRSIFLAINVPQPIWGYACEILGGLGPMV
jgi:hypothetical protein